MAKLFVTAMAALLLVGAMVAATAPDQCIVLIGGDQQKSLTTPLPPLEFYHPTADACDTSRLQMSTANVALTVFTSGCHLRTSNRIVTREVWGPDKPPMTYRLDDGTAYETPVPYIDASGVARHILGSSTSALSPSQCVSCGGRGRKTGTDVNFRADCFLYDGAATTADRWTPMVAMPRPLLEPATVAMENDFYVIGGVTGDPNVTNSQMYRYNTVDGLWHTETPMRAPRNGHSAVRLSETEILVCGGWALYTHCELYDTVKREWRWTKPMAEARLYTNAVMFDGRAYVIGGWQLRTKQALNSVEVYDAAADTWTLAKPLKNGRFANVAVAL